jgi:hypothetical protein
LAADKRGAGHNRCFPAEISLTPAFKAGDPRAAR